MGPLDLLDYQPTPRFGREPEVNAYVELHNLIAAAESIDEFSRDDLDRIGRQRSVDLSHAFLDERLRLYQILLGARLTDGDLGADDRTVLSHVAHTLALTPADLRPAHERAFGKAVTSAISDDCLDVEERLLLYKLQHLLGLDAEVADGAYGVIARERLLKTIAGALCDGTLSPDEATEVERVRSDLSLEIPPRIQEMLDGAAARWTTAHGALEPVHVHAALPAGETAYYTADGVTWTDVDLDLYRKVFATSDYRDRVEAGQTQSIRMPDVALEGPRFRGRLTVTDRSLRLHADGRGRQRINLSSLVTVQLFSNGVTARTGGGWHVFFDLGDRSERLYRVLSHLLRDEVTQGPEPPAATSDDEAFEHPARWRRLDSDEVRLAEARTPLGDAAYAQVIDHLDLDADWDDAGRIRLSSGHVVLDGSPRRTIRIDGVDAAIRSGCIVWMPLDRGRGWLIEFRDEPDARAFARSIETHVTAR